MIRAVPFATFDYFHKNLEGNGSDEFLGNRDILTFGVLRATLQCAVLSSVIKSKGPRHSSGPLVRWNISDPEESPAQNAEALRPNW